MNPKEVYVNLRQSELSKWSADIYVLKAMASGGSIEFKTNMLERVEELELLRTQAQLILQGIRHAGEERWESMKLLSELTWGSLRYAIREASARFGV